MPVVPLSYDLVKFCPACGYELQAVRTLLEETKDCPGHPNTLYSALNINGEIVMVFDPYISPKDGLRDDNEE